MYTSREIIRMFDGKIVGTKQMQYLIAKTVTLLPEKIIHYITKNCWFISSMDDAWAFAFTGNDLKNHLLIFLSDDLFRQHEEQIHYTILHEIGHVILKHRNATLRPQSKQEIKKQEKEADAFAKKYLDRDTSTV